MNYPFHKQLDSRDCGPACVRMLATYYGKKVDAPSARELCGQYRNGTTMLTLSEGLNALGFETRGVRLTWERLLELAPFPCVVQWNKNHFIVVWGCDGKKVQVSDPASGRLTYDIDSFRKSWYSHDNDEGMPVGVALLQQKTDKFNCDTVSMSERKYNTFRLLEFLTPYKSLVIQLVLSLLLGSAVSLVFPYLTQAVVDIGIAYRDVSFIICVLGGQLALSIGMGVNRYVSSWLSLHVSSRVSISMIGHFLDKMMKMKVSFFDSKMIGDLLMRIQDFTRIETFLTSYVISILIAGVGILVYGFVLVRYGWLLLAVYLGGTVLYLAWIFTLWEKRRKIDYKRFQSVGENQSMVIHYIQGMQEIKLNGCEKQKLDKWKNLQLKIYDINIAGLSLQQLQETGGLLIDNIKNLLITFTCACWVIDGSMTLGMMIAVSYVLGQLNGPLHQLASFVKAMQEAQISLERINEINVVDDEEIANDGKVSSLDCRSPLVLANVSFHYPGSSRLMVLDNVSFRVEHGTTTAIVGESGSGKSTLLKLLMGFYQPTDGEIRIGQVSFSEMDVRAWRKMCSAVLQNGYLFTETVAQNIALGSGELVMDDVVKAAQEAGIHDFIMSLPLKYDTVIGEDGLSMSGGQKQRICIARAIYRNTPFVFFDEPTNALDACNENDILVNLKRFYQNRTVIIVAHRLSTIKNADQILVLKEGRLVEQGNHRSLMERDGYYKTLVSNQLFAE